jgi:hypothetical protein
MDKLFLFQEWLYDVRRKMPGFVEGMAVPSCPGRFKFSFSGDVIPREKHWGLAQTTFAVRALLIFGLLSDLHRKEMSRYISSFRSQDGFIYDNEISSRSRLPRLASALRNLNPQIFFNYSSKFAETRQALAALINLGEPIRVPRILPSLDKVSINKFIGDLNWRSPWGAASQINHLIFFTYFDNTLSDVEKKYVFDAVEDALQQYKRSDGAFYVQGRTPPTNQRIGSAMKIFMGLSLANRQNNWVSKDIYNLALTFTEKCDACELFNANYILYVCSRHLNINKDELISRMLSNADKLRDYYWPDYGGFSFYPQRAGTTYYFAKISKGLPEPDLHGTAMLTWGIYIIAATLGIEKKAGLIEPIL